MEFETITLKYIKSSKYNPRTITPEEQEKLEKNLQKLPNNRLPTQIHNTMTILQKKNRNTNKKLDNHKNTHIHRHTKQHTNNTTRNMVPNNKNNKPRNNKTNRPKKKLTAYSLTTSEKTLADKFIKHKTHTKTDNIQEMQNFMSQKHRTNIHDISNPVAFTVSLTDFPCVGGAVFSKKCLMKSMNSFKIKKTNFKRLYDNSLREEIKICQNPFIIVKKVLFIIKYSI